MTTSEIARKRFSLKGKLSLIYEVLDSFVLFLTALSETYSIIFTSTPCSFNTYNGNGSRLNDFDWRQHREIGNIGNYIHCGNYCHRDYYCTWEIPENIYINFRTSIGINRGDMLVNKFDYSRPYTPTT